MKPSAELKTILDILEFLGDDVTEEQCDELMDKVRGLSVTEKEFLSQQVQGKMYTLMSEHEGEMGGFSRY